MCRFALYLGPPLRLDLLVAQPSNSLIQQSFQSHEQVAPLNGDGFGVAWYVPDVDPDPGQFRSIRPAWNDMNLLSLARVTRSHCILAHVRAASPGSTVTQWNCHPFTHGPLAFMHNGYIPEFRRLRRRLLEGVSDSSYEMIRGSTDSEHVFAVFLDELASAPSDSPEDASARLAGALERTIERVEGLLKDAGIEEAAKLNLAVSDGTSAAVTRFASHHLDDSNSLHYAIGQRYLFGDGDCHMTEPGDTKAIIVASEPLNEGPAWHDLPPNHLIAIAPELRYDIRPIAAGTRT